MNDLAYITTIGDLDSDGGSLDATQTGLELREWFEQHPHACGVLIVREGQMLGVISRTTFLREMSRPFGHDIHARRSVMLMLRETMSAPLILPADQDVHDAVQLALQRAGDAAYEPIVVRGHDGQLRLVDTTHLLLAQSRLLKQANEIIRKQKHEADAASMAKGQFLANMSHEIRTPMNGIIGMTNLLLETSLNATQREYLTMVQTSADWLLIVIDDVLDFSKIEAGKLEIDPAPCHIRAMLDEWLKPLAVRAQAKDLSLNWTTDAEVPEGLVIDPVRLRQIIVNLVGNAIKFTERGEVRVDLSVNGWLPQRLELLCEVRDTGIGIPPAQLSKIFREFEQVDGSNSRRFGGTGLGLAISQRLCELMGGRIWVESEEQRGSVFRFTLNVEVAGTNQPLVTGVAQTRHRGRVVGAATPAARFGLRVLVAEDNAVNQKLVRLLLEKRRHQVTVVEDGQTAVELAQTQPFDVLLIDIQMPRLDGFAATRRIREHHARTDQRVPIIALTAHAMKGDRERCLEAGMDGYVSKPISADELYHTIDGLVKEGSREADGATPPPAPADSWPLERALQHTGGDRELLARLAALFLDEVPGWLAQIRTALADRNVATVRRLAHSIKGSCVYFAADDAREAAWQLESVSSDMEGAEAKLESLAVALDRAKPQIAAFATCARAVSVST